MRVERLTAANEAEYRDFLASVPESLIYHTPAYRDFLQRVLVGSSAHYMLARDGSRLVGALPALISQSGRYGSILNSLPFYGSHGGILVRPGLPNPDAVRQTLRAAWDDLAHSDRIAAATVISNPLADDWAWYESSWRHDCRDLRIGQLTPLPRAECGDPSGAAAILSLVHQKTRNCIRKGMKSGLDVSRGGTEERFRSLWEMHDADMRAMGGRAKPWEVFEAIRATFKDGADYQLYVAHRAGQISAALLVFFGYRTAEYFTPATRPEERIFQPMSLLIYEAMCEAVRRGCNWWNWGGTWVRQTGVYQFKSRWGTIDRPYHYFTRLYDSSLRMAEPAMLLTEYPYSYVLPFAPAATPAASVESERCA